MRVNFVPPNSHTEAVVDDIKLLRRDLEMLRKSFEEYAKYQEQQYQDQEQQLRTQQMFKSAVQEEGKCVLSSADQ